MLDQATFLTKNTRQAFRRHQLRRLKHKRAGYLSVSGSEVQNERTEGKGLRTPSRGLGILHANPRRLRGELSIQEKRLIQEPIEHALAA